ncbi:phenylalanyl-tRNA synthetase mitochondrial precursor [Xylaria sp. CBS 124048]|nr:phenylalanyl-tRNA synthetase mitochondrial precursor [Xylaria sp. CBS 124048]
MWASRLNVACRSSRSSSSSRRVTASALRLWQPGWSDRAFFSDDNEAPRAVAEPAWTLPRRVNRTFFINDRIYPVDRWYNVPPNIVERIERRLHLQRDHPLSITRQIIESVFPPPTFKYHNNLNPVVTTQQNFDSLGFPESHPGRAKTDTYYINSETLLRTHTSAHQAEMFRANLSDGYLITADVYRRDEIDRCHFPIFHQMEGARSWDRTKVPNGDVAAAVRSDLESLPKHDVEVHDPNPPFHSERNPLQEGHHSAEEVEAISAHLKRSLELMVVEIFTRAKKAAQMATKKANRDYMDQPLQVRWVESYFPFTSPSWELEVFYNGEWLECLGCGVVKQDIYNNAGVPTQLGWAFGIGLDRIAMLLFNIPDIRLFWSTDKRFLEQFRGISKFPDHLRQFKPFSKHPGCKKDVSFWLKPTPEDSQSQTLPPQGFHENDVMDEVRRVAGDIAEDVSLADKFTHPTTGRTSLCYRIHYRSLESNLTHIAVNDIHLKVKQALIRKLGVEIR